MKKIEDQKTHFRETKNLLSQKHIQIIFKCDS